MAKWRAALWTRIERLTDVLHSCSVRFAIPYESLKSKEDSLVGL